MAKKIAVFTYDFLHKKSQNGILNLAFNGAKPSLIIAQSRKELTPNEDSIGVAPIGTDTLYEPRSLARLLEIPYLNCDHDSDVAHLAISCGEIDFGVILGARILKQSTIDLFKFGILNAHPGILPSNRGLDNLKRAILNNLPPVVSFHLIDNTIDQGTLIKQIPVPVYPNDSFHSIFCRHQRIEIDGLTELATSDYRFLKDVGVKLQPTPYPEKLGAAFDAEIIANFSSWKKMYG